MSERSLIAIFQRKPAGQGYLTVIERAEQDGETLERFLIRRMVGSEREGRMLARGAGAVSSWSTVD